MLISILVLDGLNNFEFPTPSKTIISVFVNVNFQQLSFFQTKEIHTPTLTNSIVPRNFLCPSTGSSWTLMLVESTQTSFY